MAVRSLLVSGKLPPVRDAALVGSRSVEPLLRIAAVGRSAVRVAADEVGPAGIPHTLAAVPPQGVRVAGVSG